MSQVEISSTRRRRGRASLMAAREAEKTPRLSTIKYALSPVEVVSADQLERIHQASMAILRDVGIDFRDETAIRQWREAGADVRGHRVHLEEDMVMDLIAKAPRSFELRSRDPEQRITVSPETLTFGTMQGAPNVRDVDGVRRASTMEDLRDVNRLTQMLPGFHVAGGFTCEPTDIAVPWRHLHINRSSLVETNLPYFGLTTGQERAEDSIAMARIAYGEDFMKSNAVIIGQISGNSPLVWDATMLEGLRVYAEANQAVLLSPFILGAANTPADVAATVAQLNAEAVAGLAYTQLTAPGAKMIYGQYSVSVSMRSGAPMSGMPEVSLVNVLVGQLARRYGIPWRTTASQSSAKTFDPQSGYESAIAYMSGATAKSNLFLHAGGWDEAGLVCCLAKFVADAEQNLLIAKYAEGISFDHFDEALEAVRRIGPGGHYLGDSFTLKRFKDAFISPEMLDYLSYEQWKAQGSKDMAQRCREKAKMLLSSYEAPLIDAAVREELDAFVAKRQEQISPSLA
ncbi:MAG: trimethylamine methyltransferase [Mesorhizobium sp.]|uniref:trimethylamine methyltransferase family protein n=1 Tax=Mesorhizobium sp. TaxID=1871066 RepID=UPI000FE4A207|nr:trimethylamine methyltransferase family protein [Mesorhizobium sp.]RWE21475.1 MAG: trimethylamine methyltransferase [Mesorhizobium sp.]